MKLVGSGTAGVVLCCTSARGQMFAVKKLTPDSDRALQRCLREVRLCTDCIASLCYLLIG